jgi:hypothetical protein
MGLLSRLVSTNDTLMALVPLLDAPPWVRRRGSGKSARTEKWIHNAWETVAPSDRLRLTQADGQASHAPFCACFPCGKAASRHGILQSRSLEHREACTWAPESTSTPSDRHGSAGVMTRCATAPAPPRPPLAHAGLRCRAKYHADEWRRDRLLALKRHMNELLFDQLPVLKDLQRVLDEMALGVGAADAASARSAALILEAVPVVRGARGKDPARPLAHVWVRGMFVVEGGSCCG